VRSEEYTKAFSDAWMRQSLAVQIRGLRESAGLTQKAFGEWCGMPQSVISRLEREDYGLCTVKTLRKIADAFGVHLVVGFQPYSVLKDPPMPERVTLRR
jgi:transcriptional regulator with XRE-family HTH domain